MARLLIVSETVALHPTPSDRVEKQKRAYMPKNRAERDSRFDPIIGSLRERTYPAINSSDLELVSINAAITAPVDAPKTPPAEPITSS